ncbi:hypothetical protein CL617_03660 [archaeon]|nr:hypothetical protein [archaeon]|tara:strand:+ start:3398 stop:4411 length:1014 start_codon:yes stop_codon:yes gene_type:complete
MILEQNFKDFYKGKDVIVTGGCGSIGRELVKHLLKCDIKKVRIFDQNEFSIHKLKTELGESEKIDYIIGNIRDYDSIRSSMKGANIAFHTAALKHVPFCETDPIEAVKTNIIGTHNLIEVAKEENLEKVIFISTDKTVYPISVMPATKLLCEKLVLNTRTFDLPTKFTCVRFGNVLKSDGSVIPLFVDQIKKGYINITDDRMSRFFMSLDDSADLVLKSAVEAQGGEIFVLKMKSLMIKDLAESLIEEFTPKINKSPEDIKINYIGARSSEKLYEQLMSDEEVPYAEDLGDRFVIRKNGQYNKDSKIDKSLFISEYSEKLSKDEIKKMFSEINLLEN